MRGRLGESLASIQKYDVPINQVTTSSLEALKAFAMGNAEFDQEREIQSLTYYKRAVELDPNFALAYLRLGIVAGNTGEIGMATNEAAKAYELRDRISEYERLYIIAYYYFNRRERKIGPDAGTDEQTYPRDEVSRITSRWISVDRKICQVGGKLPGRHQPRT